MSFRQTRLLSFEIDYYVKVLNIACAASTLVNKPISASFKKSFNTIYSTVKEQVQGCDDIIKKAICLAILNRQIKAEKNKKKRFFVGKKN